MEVADVEAVAIALPPDVQAPLALRAAQAGRHLVLDKPVALRPEDAEAIAAAVEERDLASVVFFTRRFTQETEKFLAEAVPVGGWTEACVDHLGSIFTGELRATALGAICSHSFVKARESGFRSKSPLIATAPLMTSAGRP